MKFRLFMVIGMALGVLVLAACGGDDNDNGEAAAPPATTMMAESNIVETAVAAGDFTTLASLLEQAGLAETLAGDGPYTVFAPTDAAFDKVPQETLEALQNDPEQLKAVLLYHVVQGEAKAADVAGMDSAETLNGASVKLMTEDGSVMVDKATVVQADVEASNGVIHVIDEVLIPA